MNQPKQMQWWKQPQFNDQFQQMGVTTSQQQNYNQAALAFTQAYPPAPTAQPLIANPTTPIGFSQAAQGGNNAARSAMGGGPMNAAIDAQNKNAAAQQKTQSLAIGGQVQSNRAFQGYTGAGDDGTMNPHSPVSSIGGPAQVHAGEYVLNQDAVNKIGTHALDQIQQAANEGRLDHVKLHQAIGKPAKQQLDVGGVVKNTMANNTTTTQSPTAVPTVKTVAPVTPSTYTGTTPNYGDQSAIDAANARATTAAQQSQDNYGQNQQAIGKMIGVATGNDPMYKHDYNQLNSSIGAAGAAQTAAAQQQAAQAGYNAGQVQSIGTQQARNTLGTSSTALSNLAAQQEQTALSAASNAANATATQQQIGNSQKQYEETAAQRQADLEQSRLAIKTGNITADAAKLNYDNLVKDTNGSAFVAAVNRAKAAGVDPATDPAVKAAWGSYAATQGYDPADTTALGSSIKVAGMSDVDTAMSQLKQVYPNLTADQYAALEQVVTAQKLGLNGLKVDGSGTITIDNGDGTKSSINPVLEGQLAKGDYSNATKATADMLADALGTPSFWNDAANAKTVDALKAGLAAGTLSPSDAKTAAAEIAAYNMATDKTLAAKSLSKVTRNILSSSDKGMSANFSVLSDDGTTALSTQDIVSKVKSGVITPKDSAQFAKLPDTTWNGHNGRKYGQELSQEAADTINQHVGELVWTVNPKTGKPSLSYITSAVSAGANNDHSIGVTYINPDGTSEKINTNINLIGQANGDSGTPSNRDTSGNPYLNVTATPKITADQYFS